MSKLATPTHAIESDMSYVLEDATSAIYDETTSMPHTVPLGEFLDEQIAKVRESANVDDIYESDDETTPNRYELSVVPEGYVMDEETADLFACKDRYDLKKLLAKLKEKSFFFSCEERCEIAKEVFKDYPNIKVDICSGLVVNKARELNAKFLVRGLRAVTDYENENQIHAINQYLDDDIDMVYLMAKNEQTFVSSSSVKEIFYFSGNIDKLVPPVVLKRMIEKKDKK